MTKSSVGPRCDGFREVAVVDTADDIAGALVVLVTGAGAGEENIRVQKGGTAITPSRTRSQLRQRSSDRCLRARNCRRPLR